MRFNCPACETAYDFPVELVAGGTMVLRCQLCTAEFVCDAHGIRTADGTLLAANEPVEAPPEPLPQRRYGGVGEYFFVRRRKKKRQPLPPPAPPLPDFGAAVGVIDLTPVADIGGGGPTSEVAEPTPLLPIMVGALVILAAVVYLFLATSDPVTSRPAVAAAPVDAAPPPPAPDMAPPAPRPKPRPRPRARPTPKPAPRLPAATPEPPTPPPTRAGDRHRAGSLFRAFNGAYAASGSAGRIRAVRCDERPCIVYGVLPAGGNLESLMESDVMAPYRDDAKKIGLSQDRNGEERFAIALYDGADDTVSQRVEQNFDQRVEAMWQLLDGTAPIEDDEEEEEEEDEPDELEEDDDDEVQGGFE